MKSKWASWIFVMTSVLLSLSAQGEVWGGNFYLAADIGNISSPGFQIVTSNTPRISFGWQPRYEGWGWGLSGMDSNFASARACPGGCAPPTYSQNTVYSFDAVDIFASYSKPITERFTLLGKIGVAHSHYGAYTVNPSMNYDTTANNLVGGVGVQMRLFKRFSLQLQFDEILTRSFGSGVTRFNYVSGGWLIKF